MNKKQEDKEQKKLAAMACQGAALAAGYSLSEARAAGCSLSAALAAGYSLSAALAAGYSLSEALAAGYSLSAARAAGYKNDGEWDSIPVLDKPYSRLLADIEAKKRVHDQTTFGPECDPKNNLCGTRMCTAGHLVNMAGEVGYKLRQKHGWAVAASLIHYKSRPDIPPQSFGNIPQNMAMAYIRERAKEEAEMEEKRSKKR